MLGNEVGDLCCGWIPGYLWELRDGFVVLYIYVVGLVRTLFLSAEFT